MAANDNTMKLNNFTPSQNHALRITERFASSLSILGCLFIICTFLASNKFNRPANRLIFYAALGNLAMNIGTAISLDGINMGADQPLCQIQGFLIQLFLPADAFWNLSMAINVYFTVYRNYSAERLKKNEWIYLVVNYGSTLIVAFVYCFVKKDFDGDNKGPVKMYGKATLWCWVDIEWQPFRIIFCYAPAWLSIGVAFIIYLLGGREIFRKRQEIRAFRAHAIQEPNINPFTAFKTTEVHVTSEYAGYPAHGRTESRSSVALEPHLDPQSRAMHDNGYTQYSVNISLGNPFQKGDEESTPEIKAANLALDVNAAAWGFFKCAVLFFFSLLITWLPSSIFRVHSLITGSPGPFPLAYTTGLVLPLMGFWNAVIYIVISWDAICSIATPLSPRSIGTALGLSRSQNQRDRSNNDPFAGARGQSLGDRSARGSRGTTRMERRERGEGSFSESLKGLAG